MYKLAKAPRNDGNSVSAINLTTGVCFPFDPDNTDYQAYLAWVAEGNVPTPADEENT
jgi:hypothetical protein